MDKKKNGIPKLRFPGFTGAWEQRKLGEMVDFYSGLTYSPKDVRESGTLVLRSSNVKNGEIVNADNVYVLDSIVNSNNVEIGDVIVVVRNGSRSLIGKHALVKRDMKNTVIGAFMTGIRYTNPNFINAMLDTRQFNREINKNLGATINQITTGSFKKMRFMVADSTEEQQKIGNLFKQFDSLIALHQRKLDHLKEQKKGLLQKMFSKKGEVVPEVRFPGFTDAWEQRKLGEVLVERNERKMETKDYPLMSFVKEVGIVPKGDRYNRSFLVKDTNKKYKVTKKGDFIYSSNNLDTGSIGLNRYGNACISPVYSIFYCTSIATSSFIGTLALRREFINKMVRYRQGVTYGQWRIHESDFLKIKVQIPILDEQKKIGEFFKQLDTLIALHQRKLDHLKLLKKGLLQQMFV
ncbi:restriction endonuclease subunit S [Ligilactobacillus saerimneri]|uniref:restriction endonuclease subunit S n=1 Tax=Ligilactobacillus saerimneri TaxID=228229 RepID=UPI0022A6C150|nr:restriction endonuclease subunit S [Ligilactobacillus saerimneri]MCZ0892053.1 restriction endonuclease subunit S [Ligilactobacillus saerimneri]